MERGLFRLWVVASALWIAATAGVLLFIGPAEHPYIAPPAECASARDANECFEILLKEGRKNPFEATGQIGAEPTYGPAPAPRNQYAWFASIILAPPTTFFALGWALIWIFRGFLPRHA